MTTLEKLQAKLTNTIAQTGAAYQPVPPAHNSTTLGLGGKVWITEYKPITTIRTQESK